MEQEKLYDYSLIIETWKKLLEGSARISDMKWPFDTDWTLYFLFFLVHQRVWVKIGPIHSPWEKIKKPWFYSENALIN